MRTCPRCGLLSPDKSLFCECGYDLANDVRSELGRERVGWRAAAKRELWSGVVVAVLGAVLSLVTYLGVMERGGTFYIFRGMIVVGVVLAWRGYVRLGRVADLEASARDEGKPSP